MTNEPPPEGRRLSKFSNAGLAPSRQFLAQSKGEARERAAEDNVPLADLPEHVIRDGILDAPSESSPPAIRKAAGDHPSPVQALRQKLIEELNASQETIRNSLGGGAEKAASVEIKDAPTLRDDVVFEPEEPQKSSVISSEISEEIGRDQKVADDIPQAPFDDAVSLPRRARRPIASFRRLMRRMGPRDWERRRLACLTLVHRHLFDRATEQLLFIATPRKPLYHVNETAAELRKSFVYCGPIPSKVLNWALSALPSDLKRYAFVDFQAGHGRTLLLAARRNFEFALAFNYDAESGEVLEMNLAQYPRSYMSCRDVRAIRGDRSGVVIPTQPTVLFFPDSLSTNMLETALNNVATSYRLNPRPLYLIFENAGREKSFEQMKTFQKAPLPIFDRIKLGLFSTAKVAVYRSEAASANQQP